MFFRPTVAIPSEEMGETTDNAVPLNMSDLEGRTWNVIINEIPRPHTRPAFHSYTTTATPDSTLLEAASSNTLTSPPPSPRESVLSWTTSGVRWASSSEQEDVEKGLEARC